MALRKPGVIALFDVDGTLTAPRKVPSFHFYFNFLCSCGIVDQSVCLDWI